MRSTICLSDLWTQTHPLTKFARQLLETYWSYSAKPISMGAEGFKKLLLTSLRITPLLLVRDQRSKFMTRWRKLLKRSIKSYCRNQMMPVLPVPIATKLLGEYGKMSIGWVNCQVSALMRPTKCFNCWYYENFGAKKCRSGIDQYWLRTKCGESGHKIVELEKESVVRSSKKNCTTSCYVFKEAFQKFRKNERTWKYIS